MGMIWRLLPNFARTICSCSIVMEGNIVWKPEKCRPHDSKPTDLNQSTENAPCKHPQIGFIKFKEFREIQTLIKSLPSFLSFLLNAIPQNSDHRHQPKIHIQDKHGFHSLVISSSKHFYIKNTNKYK